jgi:multiple sugar transport system permease protein
MPKQSTQMSATKRREAMTAYSFIAPTFIGFLLFILGPMIAAIALSGFEWNILQSPKFAGFNNYTKLFQDVRLRNIFLTTLSIAFWVTLLNVVLGLLIASLLDQKMHALFQRFFRASYFFPFVVSVSAVTLIWTFLMNKDLGILNYYLGLLGIKPIPWLNSSQWSPIAVVIVNVWKNLGFSVIVFLGGLQAIPMDYYDAAKVDGANGLGRFRFITLPLLFPTTFFLIVINSINAFQIFAEPYILTEGGPGDGSRTMVMYIYEQGFKFFNMGYAATVALTLFVVILILTLIQFRLSQRLNTYD